MRHYHTNLIAHYENKTTTKINQNMRDMWKFQSSPAISGNTLNWQVASVHPPPVLMTMCCGSLYPLQNF